MSATFAGSLRRPHGVSRFAALARVKPGRDDTGLQRLEGLFLVATVALGPIGYLRLDFIYLTAADLFASLTLMVMAARRAIPTNFFGPATWLWLVAFIAFAGGLSISTVVRGNPLGLPDMLAQYGFSLLVLPLVLAGRSYEQIIVLLKVLVASFVFVMAFGIYVVHFVDDPNPLFVSGSGRLRSLIERENECAVLGAVAVVLLLGLHFMGELKIKWVIPALPILLYGVLLTGSVSGLLTSTLGIGLIVLSSPRGRRYLVPLAVVLMGAAFVFISNPDLMPTVFRERVFDPLSHRDLSGAGTFAGRYELILEAFEFSRDTLVVGIGANQYRVVSSHGAPVHNMFLVTLVEGGMPALIGLIGFFLTGVYLSWLAIQSRAGRAAGATTLVVLLIYFFVFNMFPSFYARFWNVPLVLVLALSASRSMISDPVGVYRVSKTKGHTSRG